MAHAAEKPEASSPIGIAEVQVRSHLRSKDTNPKARLKSTISQVW
jgi:hypothetical protein